MATNVTLNSVSYSIPANGNSGWGLSLSNYLIALSTGVLSKAGGTFTLTGEIDFGSTYGVKAPYFKSKGTNIANAGVLRLANAENVSWRNAANGADLPLSVSASDRLTFNAVNVPTISSTDTLTNKSMSGSTNTFTDLPLTTAVTGILAAANGGTGVANTATLTLGSHDIDVTTTAATSLTLPESGTLLSDIASQTIANKTISGSNNTITNVSLSSGVTGTLALSKGGTGATTQNGALNAVLPSQASNSGKVLTTDGINASWESGLTNTLASANIFVGNGSDVATAVAVTGDVTISNAGVTSIGSGVIVNADVSASAAIAGTKISPNFGSQAVSTTGTLAAGASTLTSVTTPSNSPWSPSTVASNTLSYYQTGDWTPVAEWATQGTGTQSTNNGSYVLIGNLCFVLFRLIATKGTASGNFTIGGLPFNVASTSSRLPGLSISGISNVSSGADTQLLGYGLAGTDSIQIRIRNNASFAEAQMTAANMGASVEIYASMVYVI